MRVHSPLFVGAGLRAAPAKNARVGRALLRRRLIRSRGEMADEDCPGRRRIRPKHAKGWRRYQRLAREGNRIGAWGELDMCARRR